MAKPCCAVISCSDTRTEELLSKIYGTTELPTPETWAGDVRAYPWHISNKYYIADIFLCVFKRETIEVVSKDCVDCTQAVIISFDSKSGQSFDDVCSWMPIISNWRLDTQLLVCDLCDRNIERPSKLSIDSLFGWCIENAFELVELSESADEDLPDSVGMQRVIDALHATEWKGLQRVDSCSKPSVLIQEIQSSFIPEQSTVEAELEKPKAATALEVKDKNLSDEIDALLSETEMLGTMGNEDFDGDNFEELFAKLRLMKEKAESLPHEQRKVLAEKVTLSFWRAIGGDDSEIEDVDDLPD